MHKVEILDYNKKILLLKWIGTIDKKEIEETNKEMEKEFKKLGTPFQLLVDVSEMKLSKDNDAFVQQQIWILPKLSRLAVVVESSITKLQIRKMAEGSKNDKENFFNNFNDALAFLKK